MHCNTKLCTHQKMLKSSNSDIGNNQRNDFFLFTELGSFIPQIVEEWEWYIQKRAAAGTVSSEYTIDMSKML